MQTGPIVLACTCDERFAIGLAVTIRSILESKTDPRPVLLFVLAHELSEKTKERLLLSWSGNIEVRFLTPPVDRILQCNLRSGAGPAVYFRVLIAKLLPEFDRAIYLDSDMIVRRDIGALWDTDLAGAPLGATQELGNPTVGEPYGLPNYKELGLPSDQPYINSGLMLLDLALWRREQLSDAILDYSIRERERVLFWDQDGINALLGSRAMLLDAKWNVGLESLQRYCAWTADTEWKRETIAHIGSDPWIIHFLLHKPWQFRLDHRYATLFDEIIDRTDWKGFRAPAALPV